MMPGKTVRNAAVTIGYIAGVVVGLPLLAMLLSVFLPYSAMETAGMLGRLTAWVTIAGVLVLAAYGVYNLVDGGA